MRVNCSTEGSQLRHEAFCSGRVSNLRFAAGHGVAKKEAESRRRAGVLRVLSVSAPTFIRRLFAKLFGAVGIPLTVITRIFNGDTVSIFGCTSSHIRVSYHKRPRGEASGVKPTYQKILLLNPKWVAMVGGFGLLGSSRAEPKI